MTRMTDRRLVVPRLTVLKIALLAAITACLGLLPDVSAASEAGVKFGIMPGTHKIEVLGEDGKAVTQAGSHPYSVSVDFSLNREPSPLPFEKERGLKVSAEAPLRNVITEAPAGVLGDPTATPRCSLEDFLAGGVREPLCSDDSQVGVVRVEMNYLSAHLVMPAALYNLVPQEGEPALFGFKVVGVPTFAVPSLRSNGDYGINFNVINVDRSLPVLGSEFTFWGVPASPVHDSERGDLLTKQCSSDPSKEMPCPSSAPVRPFLTLPTDCAHGPFEVRTEVESWNGQTDFATALTQNAAGEPSGATRCDRVPFEPSMSSKPTTTDASTTTGLDFELDMPDAGLKNPVGVAQSELKKAVVKLPEGVTINPSAGEGLSACTPAEYARETASSLPGEGCPNASKLGTVQIETPLLEPGETLDGSVYLAQPDNPLTTQPGAENPFDSLVALYVVAKSSERGVIIKVPGKVSFDPATGQITTTFENLPQQPFSRFKFHFREGVRAPLASGPACGEYVSQAALTPWSAPEQSVHLTSTSLLTAGIGGGSCPANGVPPFDPALVAGSENNNAGGYSPVDIKITRQDGEQEITGFSSLLPPGLTANLTGVPFCSEAQIQTARSKTGTQEQAEPSCPAASQIGTTLVGVGVGSVLSYTPGRLYMAGPFEGAAFSVVEITSATVGPFDLGTVVVHLPLEIDPITAQVHIPAGAADQIPHIIDGIVVHVRDIRVHVDRPEFALDPTNCKPLTFSATVYGSGKDFQSSSDDVPATTTDRFQAANCAKLAFKPSFKASTSGKTSRKNGASLSVELTYPKSPLGTQANMKSVRVELPKALPSRLTTLNQACLDSVFERNPAACPAASRVGYAKATTPILPVPMVGPAYFVSHGGTKWPELIIVLQGYGATIHLNGETFISKGVTSSTFKQVPDVPVGSFQLNLPEGPYSALAAPGNLCHITRTVIRHKRVTIKVHGRSKKIVRKIHKRLRGTLTMPTTFTAQNGKVLRQNTRISVSGCY